MAQPVGAGYPVPQGAVLDVDHPGTRLAGVVASHGSQGGVGSTGWRNTTLKSLCHANMLN